MQSCIICNKSTELQRHIVFPTSCFRPQPRTLIILGGQRAWPQSSWLLALTGNSAIVLRLLVQTEEGCCPSLLLLLLSLLRRVQKPRKTAGSWLKAVPGADGIPFWEAVGWVSEKRWCLECGWDSSLDHSGWVETSGKQWALVGLCAFHHRA